MGATIIVGGQYGSEGKGKVAQFLATHRDVEAVVRIGGPNSGHTTAGSQGETVILRQLPTAAVLPETVCMVGAGSYVDPQVILEEIDLVGIDERRLVIDRNAVIVTDDDRAAERAEGLGVRLGSTCSGTGAAVMRRVQRRSREDLASAVPELRPYIGDVAAHLRRLLDRGGDVIIEGTQGFGLSLLHSNHFPKTTTRDTSAAGALSEAGLSPLDVTDIVLVLRAFPIRVSGNSGEFGADEIDWGTVTREGGHIDEIYEYTSVTHKLRRVARFDPALVREAITVNRPTTIVLNHVDYVDAGSTPERLKPKAVRFVEWVEQQIGQPIDYLGLGPGLLVRRSSLIAQAAA